MKQSGKYRNEIPSLSALDMKSYERIFKVYKAVSEDKEFYYYNILRKIDFSEVDDEFVEFYDVKTRLPMTTVSYNIYGDIKSWWILYLMNKNKFDGPPFWVEGGIQLKYLRPEIRTLLYNDITRNTVFGGRHF